MILDVWYPDRLGRPLRLLGEHRFAVINIQLKNGQIYSERCDSAKRLVGEEIIEKNRANASLAGIQEREIENSIRLVKELEHLEDVTKLMDSVTIKARI